MAWPLSIALVDPFQDQLVLHVAWSQGQARDLSKNAVPLQTGADVAASTVFRAGLSFPGSLGSYVSASSSPSLAFGADWCVDGLGRFTPNGEYQTILDSRSATDVGCGIYIGPDGELVYFSDTAAISFSSAVHVRPDVPFHFAVERIGIVVTGYLNGMAVATVNDGRTFSASPAIRLGANYINTQPAANAVLGFLKITRGKKYGGAFTPPAQEIFLGGRGYIAGEFPGGTTTVEGVPTSAEVRIAWRDPEGSELDGVVVARTISAASGTWQLAGIDTGQRFDVLGRLPGYNDVLMSNISPTSMDVVETAGAFTSNADFNGVAGEVEFVGGLPPYTATLESPLPAGLVPILDGRKLRIAGSTTEQGIYERSVRVTASNGPYVDIPLHFEIRVLYVHATGGEESIIVVEGNRYRVHTFKGSGTLNVVAGGAVEYFIVAGGGAGGAPNAGGGGGGGGVLAGELDCSVGDHDITVGQGGAGSGSWVTGQSGEDSAVFGKTAKGGGGGGQSQVQEARGNSGGSGGGSGGRWVEGVAPTPAAGVVGQGHDGGIWTLDQGIGTSSRAGAGGGGAAGPGMNAGNGVGGDGGNGVETSIRGVSERFGGGGGGGSNSSAVGAGGVGGGGGGGNESNGQSGLPNTGGGGGGTGSAYSSYNAGSGGSGVVIVRYRIANGV